MSFQVLTLVLSVILIVAGTAINYVRIRRGAKFWFWSFAPQLIGSGMALSGAIYGTWYS